MDGAQEVERNRTARAVSAKVDTGVRQLVSFGEPGEKTKFGPTSAAILRRLRGSEDECRVPYRSEWVLGEIISMGNSSDLRRGLVGCRQSGQTVVELALLLPLLLVLCLGVIEIGRYAYFDILISNAARAGAQYGAQSLIQAADRIGIQTAARSDGLNGMTVTPSQLCGCPGGTPGACPSTAPCVQQVYVQVTVSDTYDSIFGFRWLPVPPQINLSSTVTMRVSQ